MIRRIDADALMEAINTWPKFGVDERCRIVPWNEGYEPYIHLRDAVIAITGMSTIEPEQRWILCSERLPEPDEEVFVYLWDNVPYIASVNGEGQWDTEYFCVGVEDAPKAWMPLPEPYAERR